MKSSVNILIGFLFVLLALTLPLSCKKPKNNSGTAGGNNETASQIASIFNIADGAALKYQEALKANKDSIDAFLEMGKWVIQQPDVESAIVINLGMLEITYKGGLTSIISIISAGPGQERLTRGGAATPATEKSNENLSLTAMFSSGDDFYIQNKKALVFNPVYTEFYLNRDHKGYPHGDALTSGNPKLEVTYANDAAANLAVVNTFQDYGLILINSHGCPRGFSINNKHLELNLSKLPGAKVYTKEEIKTMFITANELPLEKFESGELVMLSFINNYDTLKKEVYVNHSTLVTYKYIRNLPRLDKAIVFGNFCYSGWTFEGPVKNNVSEAFRSIGAAAYYGYYYYDGSSGPVYNPFAVEMEGFLINSLLHDGDSTGRAHLDEYGDVQGNRRWDPPAPYELAMALGLTREQLMAKATPNVARVPLEFHYMLSPRYRYGCGTLTDKRDGQVYELACIGKKRWMSENLRYNAAGSLFAHNDNSTLGIYGKLYNYPMASAGQGSTQGSATIQGICPDGWHIPNQLDWENLVSALNAADDAELAIMLQSSYHLWVNDPELKNAKRNISKFSAFPAGSAFRTSKTAPIGYNPNNANFVLSTKDAGVISPEKVLSISIKQATTGGQSASAGLSGGQWVYPDATPTGDSYYSCRCVENK